MVTAAIPRNQSRYWSRYELVVVLVIVSVNFFVFGVFGNIQPDIGIGNVRELDIRVGGLLEVSARFVHLLLDGYSGLIRYPELDLGMLCEGLLILGDQIE